MEKVAYVESMSQVLESKFAASIDVNNLTWQRDYLKSIGKAARLKLVSLAFKNNAQNDSAAD